MDFLGGFGGGYCGARGQGHGVWLTDVENLWSTNAFGIEPSPLPARDEVDGQTARRMHSQRLPRRTDGGGNGRTYSTSAIALYAETTKSANTTDMGKAVVNKHRVLIGRPLAQDD